MNWQYLGQVYSPHQRGNLRSLVKGSNPKILEWVRKRITEKFDELEHWGDTINIKGSYWEYKVQLQEAFAKDSHGNIQPTHSDDEIHVWRRRI